jgi:hypothetical protein
MLTEESKVDTCTPPLIEIADKTTSFWRDALLPYLGTRLALVLVGLLGAFYILPLLKSNAVLPSVSENTRFPDVLWAMWNRFDAGFYLDIAKNGYWPASTLKGMSNWIFHPLYPLFIFPFAHLFGGSDAAFNLAGILVSNVAALVAIVYLYKLVRLDFNALVASRTILFLALFPTSFFLSAIFSESLFLACAVTCIYYARRRRWWIAGICGGLASLARIQGLALLVPVAWEYWQALGDLYAPLPDMSAATRGEKAYAWLDSRVNGLAIASEKLRTWLHLLAIALIPLGLIPFLIYSQVKTGDFLATIHNHQIGWGRYFSFPWQLLSSELSHPLAPDPLNWNFWIVNIITIGIFLGFTLWAFRRLPMTYALYTCVMVLVPLCTNSINSITRYYLVVFPAFLLLALWTTRGERSGYKYCLLAIFAMLQAVFMLFFVLGLPIIA